MKFTTSISPGKIILTGEHSVVYGKPALLSAIDKETRVEIENAENDRVLIEAGGVGMKDAYSIKELMENWQEASRAWQDYIKNGNSNTWHMIVSDPTMVARTSVGLFFSLYNKPSGVKLTIHSTIPVGSGMGSSASVAAAILGGLANHFSLGWSKDKVYEETYRIEQIAHGRASGADPAAVTYGGCLEFQKTGEEKHFQPYSLPKYKGLICLIDTGKPSETTGEMVALVAEKLKNQNSKLATTKIFEKIGELSGEVIKQVKEGKMNWEWVDENERLLEELGVVGEKTRVMIEKLNNNGIRAKVCGAGGVKTGSGMVLAYHEEPDRLQYAVGQLGFPSYQVHLGADGWRTK